MDLWIERSHVRAELTERFVEVVHLRHDGDNRDDQEDVGTRMRKLVVSTQCELERNTQTLDGANGDAADCTANAEINHRVLLAVFWCDKVDHSDRKNYDYKAVEQEACTV